MLQCVSPLSRQRCVEHKLNAKSSASVELRDDGKEACFFLCTLLFDFPDVPNIEIIIIIIIKNHLFSFRWELTSVIAGFAEMKDSGTVVRGQLQQVCAEDESLVKAFPQTTERRRDCRRHVVGGRRSGTATLRKE